MIRKLSEKNSLTMEQDSIQTKSVPEHDFVLIDCFLPEDITLTILEQLTPQEILSYIQVCKAWKKSLGLLIFHPDFQSKRPSKRERYNSIFSWTECRPSIQEFCNADRSRGSENYIYSRAISIFCAMLCLIPKCSKTQKIYITDPFFLKCLWNGSCSVSEVKTITFPNIFDDCMNYSRRYRPTFFGFHSTD